MFWCLLSSQVLAREPRGPTIKNPEYNTTSLKQRKSTKRLQLRPGRSSMTTPCTRPASSSLHERFKSGDSPARPNSSSKYCLHLGEHLLEKVSDALCVRSSWSSSPRTCRPACDRPCRREPIATTTQGITNASIVRPQVKASRKQQRKAPNHA